MSQICWQTLWDSYTLVCFSFFYKSVFPPQRLTLLHVNSNQCLDKPSEEDKMVPTLRDCSGRRSQQWILRNMTLSVWQSRQHPVQTWISALTTQHESWSQVYGLLHSSVNCHLLVHDQVQPGFDQKNHTQPIYWPNCGQACVSVHVWTASFKSQIHWSRVRSQPLTSLVRFKCKNSNTLFEKNISLFLHISSGYHVQKRKKVASYLTPNHMTWTFLFSGYLLIKCPFYFLSNISNVVTNVCLHLVMCYHLCIKIMGEL